MSSSLVLLFLAALVHAGQMAITLEQKVISITLNIKESAMLSCQILGPKFDHIHWYRFQEGRAPEHLLHYSMSNSQSALDPGFSSEKLRAYMWKDNIYKLIVSNLKVSDSGIYHCAIWDGPQRHTSPWLLNKKCHLE